MTRDIRTMAAIQAEREKAIARGEQPELDAEGERMAENKRMTFDMPINVAKVDPLR